MKKLIAVLMLWTLPKPNWPGMILKCDDNYKKCKWVCPEGVQTVTETIDGNEVLLSTGCAGPIIYKVPSSQKWNGFIYDTPTQNQAL